MQQDVTAADLIENICRIEGIQAAQSGMLAVQGQVPLSELASYQSRLNAMTGGQGRYSIVFSHYEAVPPPVQQQLTSQFQVKEEE